MLGLFTWIAPGKLVAGRAPVLARDYLAWQRAGVTLVLNLHTRPDSPIHLARHGLRSEHQPLVDFSAPDCAFLERAVSLINAEIDRGGVVAVHCQAGLGRTGTVVAAWLVHQGADPAAAIGRVRSLRPGSVETPDQEAAVHAYFQSNRTGTQDGQEQDSH